MSHLPPTPDTDHRVVQFRRGKTGLRPGPRPSPDDLAEYARVDEPDDYRQRMLVNAAAFIFVLALIGGGLWIADRMAALRHNQDCALTGRANCVPIETNKSRF
jgi:hypothetical protein